MTNPTDLAALLGSRICHDLISPIGAIGNGVELLMMEAGPVSPELTLIAESVAAAAARIRFFRIAFGQSGTAGLGRAEIAKVLSDVSQGARTRYEWQTDADVSRDAAKLAFLAILCCDSALAYGGKITVSQQGARWQVTAAAERLRIEVELWSALTTKSPDLTPAQVHFALLPALLQKCGRRLEVEMTETSITLTF
ncbi:histidine phosphotransferase family protein [Pseudorhodobacter sp.]|uniref:histidine phosphotransferase family protein n=1 Tax=Pseudorhodobacter sp. TaxID=1934400 RepID=UPI0026497492|nr:histidine phosphotransferase family protein [Pseudorhodobacter sp.]MDN5786946.1 histidine phosphotransferase family protein [Pseudorhodobacter sp.]